jgi:hypothetical protein
MMLLLTDLHRYICYEGVHQGTLTKCRAHSKLSIQASQQPRLGKLLTPVVHPHHTSKVIGSRSSPLSDQPLVGDCLAWSQLVTSSHCRTAAPTHTHTRCGKDALLIA